MKPAWTTTQTVSKYGRSSRVPTATISPESVICQRWVGPDRWQRLNRFSKKIGQRRSPGSERWAKIEVVNRAPVAAGSRPE
jgi:hypothetical protein